MVLYNIQSRPSSHRVDKYHRLDNPDIPNCQSGVGKSAGRVCCIRAFNNARGDGSV